LSSHNQGHLTSPQLAKIQKELGLIKKEYDLICPKCKYIHKFLGYKIKGELCKLYCLSCNQIIFFTFDKKGVHIYNYGGVD
jgi:hypothetical protein